MKKKYKVEDEELAFETSGNLPGNRTDYRVINLMVPQTIREKHLSDEEPCGKSRRSRMMQTGRPMRLAPSYQGIFYVSYKIVVKSWHGKHTNTYEIPVTVTGNDANA